jgi:hypothetical protein
MGKMEEGRRGLPPRDSSRDRVVAERDSLRQPPVRRSSQLGASQRLTRRREEREAKNRLGGSLALPLPPRAFQLQCLRNVEETCMYGSE